MWSMKIELKDDEVEVLAKAAHGNMYVAQFVESMVRGFIAAQQSVQRIGEHGGDADKDTEEANAVRESCNPLFFTNR